MNKKPDISVVVPCYNEEKNLPELVTRVSTVMSDLGLSHEIIIVDDGSRDETLSVATKIARKFRNIKVVSLTRNFGHQASVTAGIDLAQGNAVVLIDADLQDPPEVIGQLVQKWKEGYDVVYAQRVAREGENFLKILTAKFFYRLLQRMTHSNIPVDTGDFRLMDRKVVVALAEMRERHRFIRGMVSWVGFNQVPVMYDRKPRLHGTTSYSYLKMLLFALDAITSFSIVPLRLLTILGMFVVATTTSLALLVLCVRVFDPTYFIPGFSALAFLMLMFGGIQLLSLGIIGEYVGRIFEEVKRRPLYLIKEIYHFNTGKNRAVRVTGETIQRKRIS